MLRALFIMFALGVVLVAIFVHSVHQSHHRLYESYIFHAVQYCDQSVIRKSIPIMHHALNANGTLSKFGTIESTLDMTPKHHHRVEIDLMHTTMEKLSSMRKASAYTGENKRNRMFSSYDVIMARMIGVINDDNFSDKNRARELYHRLFSVVKSVHYPGNMNISQLAHEAFAVKWYNELASLPEYCGANQTKNSHPAINSLLGIGTYDLGAPFATRYSNLLTSTVNLTELNMTSRVSRINQILTTSEEPSSSSSEEDSDLYSVELQSMILYNEFKGDTGIHSQIVRAWCPGCVHSIQFPACDRFTLLKSGHVIWERLMNAHVGGFFPMTLLYLNPFKSKLIDTYHLEFQNVRSIVHNDKLNHHQWSSPAIAATPSTNKENNLEEQESQTTVE